MLILELRIVLPMTKEEYQVGMLHGVAMASLEETGGGEGVEVLRNEPYENVPLMEGKFNQGQYTEKIYHLESKVPTIIKYLAPRGSLQLHEEAWNAHPDYCRTVITNPGYMKKNFELRIETLCVDGDRGHLENAHLLNQDKLNKRKVVVVDVANDPMPSGEQYDPRKYMAMKPNPPRGPLIGPKWKDEVEPVVTVYKLITIEFKWLGLQGNVESFAINYEQTLFRHFHRKIFCTMDEWFGMTMEQVRELEEETKRKLEEQREHGEVRGSIPK